MLGIAALLVGAPAASAHTDFDSSTPAHGDVVAEPVSSVVVVFTADTQPVDDLLVALDANGNLQAPSGFTTQDQRTFTVAFDPPLAGGDIGIRWTVLGADGHALEGSFAFNVTAPPPTTPPPAPVEPVDTIADVDDASVPASDTVVVEEIEPAPAQQSSADELADPDGPFPDAAPEVVDSAVGAEVQSLDDFLIVAETSVPGRGRLLLGGLLSIPAIAGAIGALAFLAFVLRGSTHEIATVVTAIRIAGALAGIGALTSYLGSISATGESFVGGWFDSSGRTMALRLVGAVLLSIMLRASARTRSPIASRPMSLSAAVIDGPVSTAPDGSVRPRSSTGERWDAAASKPALAGVVLLVASFWFDGHTVTKGWRPLHAVVNGVHVVAGSVWFGGLVTLAALAWWRYRRGDDARVGELLVRFSSIATVALVAVALAGLVLAVFVLDGFGELTGTEWGRTLLLKSAAVALAATLGAYNHFRLRPVLAQADDDATVRATLRSVLTAEAILLTFVVIVTAWLVVAAT